MEMAARGHERAAAPYGLLLGYLGRAAFKNVKRGPHRCRPLQVGDILRLAVPRRPRRLNVHVSRTLKAAASGKQFIPRKVAFNAHSSQNNTRWAVTPGSYPPIFIGVSRSIHIVMGVYPTVGERFR